MGVGGGIANLSLLDFFKTGGKKSEIESKQEAQRGEGSAAVDRVE